MSTQFDRELISVIEIDQDFCQNDFGVSPCEATEGPNGAIKCWNTYATCTNSENYNRGSLTLYFTTPQSRELDFYAIPLLKSFSLSPSKVNIGSRASNSKPLGTRGSVTISLADTIHTDNVVDPYVSERDYNPLERGTFWTKWLSRNPYYTGRNLRVKTGFAGQDYADFITRHYVIDTVTPSASGDTVTIRALDVLRLADDEKAKCPPLSEGQLGADISDSATSLILTNTTIDDYSDKIIRIGDEIITYTTVTGASAPFTLSGLTRGAYNTEASSHDEDDTVQACTLFSGYCWEVAREILVNYGNIDESYIDYDEWVTEGSTWLSQFNVERVVSEPEGVTSLLGSLSQSCMFFIWVDEENQKIKFKAIRPEGGNLEVVSQSGSMVQNKTSLNIQPEFRASDVWVSYLLTNATNDVDSSTSYNRTRARTDASSWSTNEYGERVVYEVKSPWLISDGQAATLAFRTLSRYRDGFEELSFTTDIKDVYDIGQVVNVYHDVNVSFTGETALKRYQITSRAKKQDTIEYKAVTYVFSSDYCMIMDDNAPDYDDATTSQKQNGGYIAPLPDGKEYKIL